MVVGDNNQQRTNCNLKNTDELFSDHSEGLETDRYDGRCSDCNFDNPALKINRFLPTNTDIFWNVIAKMVMFGLEELSVRTQATGKDTDNGEGWCFLFGENTDKYRHFKLACDLKNGLYF